MFGDEFGGGLLVSGAAVIVGGQAQRGQAVAVILGGLVGGQPCVVGVDQGVQMRRLLVVAAQQGGDVVQCGCGGIQCRGQLGAQCGDVQFDGVDGGGGPLGL
ncbi:Uncharacterised protein [Mycobacteroides abscessus subsp. abscessus]|nr:Uncharacterised protein [Mycobacteroides abscessus subsp. abscessus]